MRRETSAIFLRLQRAQPVRQGLGQHRHDAVGEVHRIAALVRLAVERAARRDIVRDIGNRDHEMPSIGVLRIGVRLGPDRVVEIARVAAVNRDQVERAQIGPAGAVSRLRRRRLGEGSSREDMRDLELRDRYEADGSRRFRRAKPLDDPDARWAVAPRRQRLCRDQLTISRAGDIPLFDDIFAPVAAVGRNDAAAIMGAAKDPDDGAQGFAAWVAA
jgi:hypothetical protein